MNLFAEAFGFGGIAQYKADAAAASVSIVDFN